MRDISVFCSEPKSLSEILSFLGLKDRENLMHVYIGPMIKEGMLAMTDPENPTSRKQQYVSVGQSEQDFGGIENAYRGTEDRRGGGL